MYGYLYKNVNKQYADEQEKSPPQKYRNYIFNIIIIKAPIKKAPFSILWPGSAEEQ
jgi:hypothetical protein